MSYVDGLVSYLVQMLSAFLFALFYPVYKLVNIFISVVLYIWHTFAGFVNSIIGLANNFSGFISDIFTTIFPNVWVFLILTGLVIVIGLRLYSFLKDISIAGFKI